MADQATDTASAALLKLRNEVAGIIGLAEYELRQAVGNTNVNVLRLRLEEADAVLASLPAPAAPEKPNPKDCGATDYPVWGDGSHDTVTCARPAGHEGPHTGLIGAHQWTW